MNVNISVRHSEVTQETKGYAEDKAQKLGKFQLQRVDMVLESEGDQYKVEVVAHLRRGGTAQATAVTNEWFSSIDQTIDKVEKQLRRAKDKIKSHRVKKYQHDNKQHDDDEDSYQDIVNNMDIGTL